jgi:hypothetical protein
MRVRCMSVPASSLVVVTMLGCSTTPGDMGPGQAVVGGPQQPGAAAGVGGTEPLAGQAAEPPAGAAGVTAVAGTGAAGVGAAGAGVVPPEDDPIDHDFGDPRGCPGLNSGFPGDEACMLPPDPADGFQIHVGPKDYNDPVQINRFSFAPGRESSECWSFHTPNTQDVYYQSYVLSGRPGTHHIINTMYRTDFPDGTTFTMCMDGGTGTNSNSIGNLPGASKAYMPRRRIAPENQHLGRKIPANTASQADMHYFNFTDRPILREFWMNIYTVSPEGITAEANQIRGMGGLGWLLIPIPPASDQVWRYSCPINAPGRITALLGHYHAHGRRFTTFIRRGGVGQPCNNDTWQAQTSCEKVFEMYDYNDPASFTYDSITTNPMFSTHSAGATSGILEVATGDVVDWECHIVNVEPDGTPGPPLRYTNFVQTGEMCNLWGESVGPLLNCVW